MNMTRFAARLLALALVAGIPAMGWAQTNPTPAAMMPAKMHAPHVTIAHPIKVNTCNPQRGSTMVAGFVPAYYPGAGPYFWPDVYGYRYYQRPVQGHPTLAIDYINETNVVMKEIEFGLVARGELLAEVRDAGTFSPNVEIKHEFGISSNLFPMRTGMAACVPLKITFADGTKWKNPHLPALRKSIYGHP